MSERLTRIYTRSGDKGTTGLGNGSRVAKTSIRIEVLGTVDELNAALGVVIAQLTPTDASAVLLSRLQHQLFDLGAELAMADPDYITITESHITELEQQIDRINADLPALREFILPGGNLAAAHGHLARCICRRAERRMQQLVEVESGSYNPAAVIYLNRLSDLLFVLCRQLARQQGGDEVYWRPGNLAPDNDSQQET